MKWLCGIFFVSHLVATTVGNPAAPHMIYQGIFTECETPNLRLGYEGDFVFNGRAEQEGRRVDVFTQTNESGTVTLNLFSRWDIYGVLGSSDLHTDWRFIHEGAVSRMEYKTHTDFFWGVGSRAIYFERDCVSLGIGGRYSTCHYQPESLFKNGESIAVEGTHCKWQEWQINTDVAYEIYYFIPYFGVKYSNARTSIENFSVPLAANGSGNVYFKNKGPVGVYIGCGISSGEYVFVNLESRLVDEEAVSVTADIRF
jgi:hypothetical protein